MMEVMEIAIDKKNYEFCFHSKRLYLQEHHIKYFKEITSIGLMDEIEHTLLKFTYDFFPEMVRRHQGMWEMIAAGRCTWIRQLQ